MIIPNFIKGGILVTRDWLMDDFIERTLPGIYTSNKSKEKPKDEEPKKEGPTD